MLVNTYSVLLALLARACPQFPMSIGARVYLQLDVSLGFKLFLVYNYEFRAALFQVRRFKTHGTPTPTNAGGARPQHRRLAARQGLLIGRSEFGFGVGAAIAMFCHVRTVGLTPMR